MATHSRILAWRIPWREEPCGLQSTGSHKVGHDRATRHTWSREQPCPESGSSFWACTGPPGQAPWGSGPLTPVAKMRSSPDLQSSTHTPRGLQPCDASGLGKGRASRLQGAEKPSRGPGSSWGGGDAGGLGAWQVQLLEEGAQRRHKVACVPAPAQRQALLLMLPVRMLHSHCRLPGCEPKSRVCLAETPGCSTWGGGWRKYWLPDWTRRG